MDGKNNMDIKKFLTSEKFSNDYNDLIQKEHESYKKKDADTLKTYKVSELDFIKSKIEIKSLTDIQELKEFQKICDHDGIAYSGPMIKKYFDLSENVPIKRQYNVFLINVKPKDIISKFTEGAITKGGIKIGQMIFNIDKRQYNSINQILLSQEDTLNRIVFFNDELYVSGLFIFDLYKKISCYDANNIDPVYGYPEDILDIYDRIINNTMTIQNMIDMCDYEEIQKIDKQVIEKEMISYKNEKYTTLEYLIMKMMEDENEHPIIIFQLRNIFLLLATYEYFRPPWIIAKMIGFDKKYIGEYDILLSSKSIDIKKEIGEIKTVYQVDMFVVNNIIEKDEDGIFVDYVSKIGVTKKFKKITNTSTKIIDWIIENKSMKIINTLFESGILSEYYFYKIIFMTQEFNLLGNEFIEKYVIRESTETINDTVRKIILGFLPEIINNSLTRSFYMVYRLCPDILDDGSILHLINNDNSVDILEIILKKSKNNIKDIKDSCERTPIIKYAELGLKKCIIKILEHGCDYELTDKDNNTFLHVLCKNGRTDIIQAVVRNIIDIIDSKNNKLMTPIMVAAENKHEEIFYILKGLNANLDTVDIYGNTVYHYLCNSKICHGLIIVNKKNKFGFTPYDYCKTNKKFYHFQN